MMTNTVYDKIGTGYNRTRAADPYIAQRLRDWLAPATRGKYLDIGCGTGNYTCQLAEDGLSMTGVDPSETMLETARSKAPGIHWMRGSAAAIPLPNASMHGAIATLTIHHWPDLDAGFRELSRVLVTGSRLVIFTFTKEQERGYWFNHFWPQMMQRTFQKAITLETTCAAAIKAGFTLVETEKYFVQPDLQDMFGYSGKHNPEIYFDSVIRNGISSFSLLAEPEEVIAGLEQLRYTIDNGEFAAIKQRYDNDNGDYLFATFEKR